MTNGRYNGADQPLLNAAKPDNSGRSPTMPRVSAVIPTLNEAENLRILLPLMPDWIHEIIVVDGHSTDGTIEVARGYSSRVKVVIETQRGKGAALRSGFAAATGDVIVALDADCSGIM